MLTALLTLFHGCQPTPAPTMLVQPAALSRMLEGGQTRLLDTRSREAYIQGHIPGAIRVEVKSWQDQGRKPGGFRDAAAWSRLVGALGITHQSRVVVYGDQLPETARVWWLLKYLGLKEVAILDGGWSAWQKADLPASTGAVQPAAATFTPDFQADRLEEIDSLKNSVAAGKAKVVDARSGDEFTGKDVRGKRGGHIPGSTHLEWKDLLEQDGRFRSAPALRDLFKRKGITPEDTLITC